MSPFVSPQLHLLPRCAGPGNPAGRPGRRPRLPLGGGPRSKFCLLLADGTLPSRLGPRVWYRKGPRSYGPISPPSSFRFLRCTAPRPPAALPPSGPFRSDFPETQDRFLVPDSDPPLDPLHRLGQGRCGSGGRGRSCIPPLTLDTLGA